MRRLSQVYPRQLQYREIAREIIHDIAIPRRPLDSYEYDKYIHIVDIPLKDTIIGHIDGKRNILVFNFWALMFGLLMNRSVDGLVDTGGEGYTVRSSGDTQFGSAYLVYGTGTTPEVFTQNALVAYSGSISTSRTFGQLSDRNRITLSGVVPADSQEIGVYQPLYDPNSIYHTTMLARKQMSISANKTVNYYIDFLMPWGYNWALLMYGILSEANVSGAIDVNNASYTLRSSGDVNAGPARIRVSKTAYSWSPSLTNISYDLELSTYWWLANYRSVVYLFLVGLATPSSDLSVNTIALIQSLFDTAVTAHDTYVLILPLSSPITLYAGRANLIFLRFVAM